MKVRIITIVCHLVWTGPECYNGAIVLLVNSHCAMKERVLPISFCFIVISNDLIVWSVAISFQTHIISACVTDSSQNMRLLLWVRTLFGHICLPLGTSA